jgi:hypothetical protein
VTNRFAAVHPHSVAGAYDANYAACTKLANPSDPSKGISGHSKWPTRFGAEPNPNHCR